MFDIKNMAFCFNRCFNNKPWFLNHTSRRFLLTFLKFNYDVVYLKLFII